MEYNNLIEPINNLDFVESRDQADAAIKATLGRLVSAMDEQGAKEITGYLPKPLTYDKLRSHQENPINIDRNEFIAEISNEFNLDNEKGEKLVKCVFQATRDNLSEDQANKLKQKMPKELSSLIEGQWTINT